MLEASMTETPRRGRPPKKRQSITPFTDDGLDSTFDEKQEGVMKKRKRGRPPKSRLDTSASTVATPQASKDHDKQEAGVTPKRRRGRPKVRKDTSPHIEITPQGSTNGQDLDGSSTPKSRSLTRNTDVICEELDSTYDEKMEHSTTKKHRRGRPPKNRRDTSLNMDDTPGVSAHNKNEEPTESKSRRRSRLLKNSRDISPQTDTVPGGLDSSPDEKQEGSKKIKRGRGRPPKKQDTSLHTESDHEDKSETDVDERQKHPGRPKSIANPNQDYTCVHCGVVLTSAQMCSHMLRDHYRVWNPSNQEGTLNLMRVIKRFGKLKCQRCEKPFNSAQYYSYHVKWCGREDERAICPICNSNQKAMWLHAHILEHKRKEKGKTQVDNEVEQEPKTKRKAAAKALEQLKDLDLVDDSGTKKQKEQGSDYEKDLSDLDNVDDDDDDDDDDDGDDEGGSDNQLGGSSSNKRTPCRRDGEKRSFHAEAYQLTKNRLAKYSGIAVLPSLMPCLDDWEKLSQSEAKCYLPTEMISVKFEVSHILKSKTQKVNDPQQLAFGESHLMEDGFIAYCGGAIWALDWCPAAEKTGEFLAVACHRDFDHVTPVDHSTTGPGLIQLWNLGQLQHRSNYKKLSTRERIFPKLECVIAIDDGVILDMKWCPLGGSTDNTNTDQPQRLGLLAVATTSGFVHLYSIPKLDSLQKLTDTHGSYITYKVQPSRKLCQNFNSQPDSPCLCISWSVSLDLTRLAAGFGDGTISVWNLSSSSTLDHDISGTNNIIMWPCITFMAHEAPVSGVDFCPSSPDLLISCGFGRNLRRWDLRDPDLILENSLLRSKLQHACWPSYFNIILTVSDQCYAANTTATYCVESSEDSTSSINVFLHDGCAWNVCYSHWTNGFIVCDVTGDVFYMVLPRVWCVKAQQKSFYSRRMSLLKITKRSLTEQTTPDENVTTDETTNTADGNLQRENTNDKPGEDTSEASATDIETRSTKIAWKDCIKKYILDFGFYTKDAPYRHVSDEIKPLDYKTILEPAMQSVNRVVFSPNASCYTWAACGGQAGLLCVKKVPTLIDKLPIPATPIILK